MNDFKKMSEEDKDKLTCDDVFCLYLRDISKLVNENYYKQCLRFVLLYRECMNEFGWLKRRETYMEAGMMNEDSLLASLKTKEDQDEKDEDDMGKIEAEINSDQDEEESEKASPKKPDSPKKEENQEKPEAGEDDADMKEEGKAEEKEEEGEDEEKSEKKDDEKEEKGEDGEEEKKSEKQEEEEEIYIPQAEYSAVCNGDFLPMICNDFIQEFLEKDHGACNMNKTEAINLTRNFCHWVAINGLTCARI